MYTSINKRFSFAMVMALVAILISSISFTSCNKDDDDKSSGVQLWGVGPSVVNRGATLNFKGQNLSGVSAVVLPTLNGDGIEVSASEFKDFTDKGFQVVVPNSDELTTGQITIKFANGSSIVTATQIVFGEAVLIKDFSPLIARSGDVITINSDGYNNFDQISYVEFSDGAKSSEFVSRDGSKIAIKVPDNAQTGTFALVLKNGSSVYSSEELEVVLPSISSMDKYTLSKADGDKPQVVVRPGVDFIKITGENLDLARTFVFKGEGVASKVALNLSDAAVVEQYQIKQSANEIIVKVPFNVHKGSVAVLPGSKIEVAYEDYDLAFVQSTIREAEFSSKNGEVIKVTSDYQDLITGFQFVNEGGSAIDLEEDGLEIIWDQDSTRRANGTAVDYMNVTIPTGAISGCTVQLLTSNGETINTGVPVTLIEPSDMAFKVAEGVYKDSVVITGNDLDLVKSIVFAGYTDNEIDTLMSISDHEIAFFVPKGVAVSDDPKSVTVILKNGKSIEGPKFTNIVELPTISSFNGSELNEYDNPYQDHMLVINGSKFDDISELYINGVLATTFIQKTDELMKLYIPHTSPNGLCKVYVITKSGAEGYIGPDLVVTKMSQLIFESREGQKLSWSANAKYKEANWSVIDGPGTIEITSILVDESPTWSYYAFRIGNKDGIQLWDAGDNWNQINIDRKDVKVGDTMFGKCHIDAVDVNKMTQNGGVVYLCGEGNTAIVKIEYVKD